MTDNTWGTDDIKQVVQFIRDMFEGDCPVEIETIIPEVGPIRIRVEVTLTEWLLRIATGLDKNIKKG